MLKHKNIVFAVLVVATLFAIGATPGSAFAQKAAVPKPQDKVALGEEQVKQLLLLIDTDKRKTFKARVMKFMEAEFGTRDTKESGELEVKELTQSKLRIMPLPKCGK